MNNTASSQQVTPIYIVSGGKGVAGHTMVHSLLIQYPDNKIPVNIIPEVQSEKKILDVVLKVKEKNGIICHTMVKTDLRNALIKTCKKYDVKEFDFMGKLSNYLENELKFKSVNVPGLYRRTNAQYFNRIEAIEFSLNHDDGLNPGRLNEAEIILTGVSRSGKTPLSVYMSMFGWKVANVPIVKGIQPPKELFIADHRRVFGLMINSSHLISQRQKRLSHIGDFPNKSYIEQTNVTEELRYANFIFDRGKFTKINVTNKPVETTANEIIGYISDRFGHQDRRYKK